MSAVEIETPAGCDAIQDGPLRIALVHTADQGGGAEVNTLSLHLALKRLGHDSQLYVGTKPTSDPDVHEIPRFHCFPGVLRGAQLLEQRLGWQYLYHPWFRQLDRLFRGRIDVFTVPDRGPDVSGMLA